MVYIILDILHIVCQINVKIKPIKNWISSAFSPLYGFITQMCVFVCVRHRRTCIWRIFTVNLPIVGFFSSLQILYWLKSECGAFIQFGYSSKQNYIIKDQQQQRNKTNEEMHSTFNFNSLVQLSAYYCSSHHTIDHLFVTFHHVVGFIYDSVYCLQFCVCFFFTLKLVFVCFLWMCSAIEIVLCIWFECVFLWY